MPDRDIFSDHVPRGWRRSAVRLRTGAIVPPDALENVVWLARRDLKRCNSIWLCRLLSALEEISASVSDQRVEPDFSLISRMREIAAEEDTRFAELAVRRFIKAVIRPGGKVSPVDLIRDVMVDYIEMQIANPTLNAEIEERHRISLADQQSRLYEIRELLKSSMALQALSHQLASGVPASKVRLPKRQAGKRTTRELTFAALA